MALPVEINPLQLKTSGGYSVSKSLRFRSSASAYLNRTPASATNRKTWTWSGWVKLGTLSVIRVLFGAGQNSTTGIDFGFLNDNTFFYSINGVGTWTTTAVFRDPSAWYHVVFAFDSTQATQANRSIVYINGVNYAFSSNGVVQNNNYDVNNNIAQYFGYTGVSGTPQYFDGYMAEVNFIDGQALTASSFGTYDTNGVWQPIKYSGTYGTNGFYLNFGNTTSTTTLGYDTSGNSNNWTPNNISLTAGSTYDSMLDVPTLTSATAANFSTINPLTLYGNTNTTLSNGNLNLALGTVGQWRSYAGSTVILSPGTKWYFEGKITNSPSSGDCEIGIAISTAVIPTGSYNAGANTSVWYYEGSATKTNGSGSAYGATYGAGDVIGVALDMTNGQLTFYKNGTSQGLAFTVSTAQSYVLFLGGASSVPSWALNFGQQPWAYAPPTGFVGTNTYNLPTPTIANGAQYMAATTYTGTGATQTISDGGNNTIGTTFQPDLVWLKSRSAATDHALYDVVRGTTLDLASNTTAAETTQSTGLTAFGSTGFTIGALAKINTNAATYVAWQWKANGTGVSNTNGSITSTVSANTTAGFSVVTYTAPASGSYTVGHGLGVVPAMIIVKDRTQATNWNVYHISLGNTLQVQLNTTGAQSAGVWNSTSPTSSVFSSTVGGVSFASDNVVAYCWAAVPGYSAFGSYTGNGSADGPFVYTGFRPRFILTKRTDAVNTWELYDTSRSAYNAATAALYPNTSAAETTDDPVDILSNGFKMRASGNAFNTSGGTYIYAAFAENPFNSSRAR